MRLRRQLILVATVTLALPWAAWQYLTELEAFLRQGEERALLAGAGAMAGALAAGPLLALPAAAQRRLYVRPGARPVVDGYADEWQPWLDWTQPLDPSAPERARLALAEDEQALYLLLQVRDPRVVYEDPGLNAPKRSDHLIIELEDADGAPRRYLLSNSAPGWVVARPMGGAAAEPLRGEWQDVAGGYSLELRIPHGQAGDRLGLTLVNVDDPESREEVDRLRLPPTPLLRPSPVLAERLAELALAGRRVWLLDAQGWVLARAGELSVPAASAQGWPWWRHFVYRYLIRPPLNPPRNRQEHALRLEGEELQAAAAGTALAVWRPAEGRRAVTGSAASPVRQAGEARLIVLLEQGSEDLLLFTNQALGRLLALTGLVLLLVVGALLGYASLLSARIRRLRNAAEAALGQDGRVRPFKPSRQRDELGDLSRAVARSLERLREHTDYLQTLASKLSHELRTPLAVVGSSLDNLQAQALPAAAQPYVLRAREGTERLSGILRAMSEAQRIEESLRAESPETFPLDELLANCLEAYRAVSPEHRLRLDMPAGDYRLRGMPELLVQMLDKLMDNAFSFAPKGAEIRLGLRRIKQGLELRVANAGPPLPRDMQARLFDSMVSLREGRGDGPHLGLGLYIVRLVAQLHGGGVQARDLPGARGVEFVVLLRDVPLAP
ncbi:ATP-binding protein [Alkalilimnicola sp. S0819]|uniref:ATP-binding protein n=1 Tax=Alkalilimnicola sp. S0819 TaxID=2613922 RepID=UPI0012618FFC|nr:ATP-binding protein [Alkalilimnicola sp. S0819]KAB7628333.1 HAMP domain-containing protein [Alkalilimnicola sp. S0819]MPQ15232.1 HAMP domain-containing protein [Alkalilimnicola sp. S0819]